MAENKEKVLEMQSNPTGTYTSTCSRKRKVVTLTPEAPEVGDVEMCQFLFEKKLTHSDVKGQNRIIIPKAYAEKFFGEFVKEERSSYVFMDDIRTGKVWKFCLRSWQNGGSRMYVLEGTAKYTQEQNIKVGDFIMLYKDDQTEKYRISWRKKAEEEPNHPADGSEKDDLPPSSSQLDCFGKKDVQASSSQVGFADEYRPQFHPHDETSQFFQTSDTINPQYVMENFNMTWNEFLNFNPFDY